LRFFAGGPPEDISVVRGVSHAAVYDSVWRVADAANKTFLYLQTTKNRGESPMGFEETATQGLRPALALLIACCCGLRSRLKSHANALAVGPKSSFVAARASLG